MTASTATIELLAALLRGGEIPAGAYEALTLESLLDAVDEHGVLPLIAATAALARDAPPDMKAAITLRAREHMAADMVAEVELRAVLEALRRGGVQALLMKGAQLAYSHYPRPDLRPRLDTDLVVAEQAVGRVHDVVVGLGYTPARSVGERMVMSQRSYEKRGPGSQRYLLDVHWKLANPLVFADLLSVEELSAGAVAVPALGPSARGLSPVHALFVACVHRVAHHLDAESLIWLYDIHLIASGFNERDWQRFVELAAERGVATICRTGLERAMHRLATPVPPSVLDDLARRGSADREITAAYLMPHRSRAAAMLDDLKVLPTWGERWRLIREHVLPEASYMREVYAPASGEPLPILYLRRAVRGAWKWLGRQ